MQIKHLIKNGAIDREDFFKALSDKEKQYFKRLEDAQNQVGWDNQVGEVKCQPYDRAVEKGEALE